MSTQSSSSGAPPEPTDVRFSIRALLIAMVVVAIGAAAIGPHFRSLAPDERASVVKLWVVSSVIVVSFVGFHARNRILLERQAGRTIIALPRRGKIFGQRVPPWLNVFFGCVWIGFGLFYMVSDADDLVVWPVIVWRGFLGAMIITLGIVTIWWSQKIQLRENGVLHGLNLLRWSHVTDHRWKDSALFFEGVNQRHSDIRLSMIVPPDQQSAVNALLAKMVHARVRRAPGDVTEAAPTSIPLPPIPIRAAGQPAFTFRGAASVVMFYVAICVMLAYRPFGRPSREFVYGAAIGWGLAALNFAFGARRSGAAGAPLVRLLTRMDWPSVIAAALIALGCYYIHQQLLFPPTVIGNALGIGSGLATAVILGMILRDKFDLCENGVMLVRWTFWPWRTMRVSKWNRDSNGRLVLRHGWRRIAAKVPAEQREAVDAVLKEKIA